MPYRLSTRKTPYRKRHVRSTLKESSTLRSIFLDTHSIRLSFFSGPGKIEKKAVDRVWSLPLKMSNLASNIIDHIRSSVEDAVYANLEAMARHVADAVGGDFEAIFEAMKSFDGGSAPKYSKEKKTLPFEDGKVTIVLNYSDKTHAVFGDTKPHRKNLMDLNRPKKFLSFNPRLAYGPGWVIMDKSRVDDVVNCLTVAGLEISTIDRSEIDGVPVETAETDPSPPEDEQVVPEPEPEPEPEPIKKRRSSLKSASGSSTDDTINDFGNCYDEKVKAVYCRLPIGVGGRNVKVVVGLQDFESEETGLASVIPLDEKTKKLCTRYKMKTLATEIEKLDLLAESDPEIYQQLSDLYSRG